MDTHDRADDGLPYRGEGQGSSFLPYLTVGESNGLANSLPYDLRMENSSTFEVTAIGEPVAVEPPL